MPDPYDLVEEAKDLIEEITDLPNPMPALQELHEFIESLIPICQVLCEDDAQPKGEPAT